MLLPREDSQTHLHHWERHQCHHHRGHCFVTLSVIEAIATESVVNTVATGGTVDAITTRGTLSMLSTPLHHGERCQCHYAMGRIVYTVAPQMHCHQCHACYQCIEAEHCECCCCRELFLCCCHKECHWRLCHGECCCHCPHKKYLPPSQQVTPPKHANIYVVAMIHNPRQGKQKLRSFC